MRIINLIVVVPQRHVAIAALPEDFNQLHRRRGSGLEQAITSHIRVSDGTVHPPVPSNGRKGMQRFHAHSIGICYEGGLTAGDAR